MAQIEVAAPGLSSSLFAPLIWGAVVYVVLFVAGAVLEGRGHARGEAVGDVAFAVLLLMGLYTAVLLVTAIAQKYSLVVRMLEVLAIVMVFFAVLLVVLFALGQLFGLIGRLIRRDDRVVAGEQPPA